MGVGNDFSGALCVWVTLSISAAEGKRRVFSISCCVGSWRVSVNINSFQLISAGFKLSQISVDLCPIYVSDIQSLLFFGASGGSGLSFLRSAYVGEEWCAFRKACVLTLVTFSLLAIHSSSHCWVQKSFLPRSLGPVSRTVLRPYLLWPPCSLAASLLLCLLQFSLLASFFLPSSFLTIFSMLLFWEVLAVDLACLTYFAYYPRVISSSQMFIILKISNVILSPELQTCISKCLNT